ncbi:MAG: hypothetical protein ABIH69_06735 [bacterium]
MELVAAGESVLSFFGTEDIENINFDRREIIKAINAELRGPSGVAAKKLLRLIAENRSIPECLIGENDFETRGMEPVRQKAVRAPAIVSPRKMAEQLKTIKAIAQGLLFLPSHCQYGLEGYPLGVETEQPFKRLRFSQYPRIDFPAISFDFAREFMTTDRPFELFLAGELPRSQPLFKTKALPLTYSVDRKGDWRGITGCQELLHQVGIERRDVDDAFLLEYFPRFVGVDSARRLLAFPSLLNPGGKYLYHGWGRNYNAYAKGYRLSLSDFFKSIACSSGLISFLGHRGNEWVKMAA